MCVSYMFCKHRYSKHTANTQQTLGRPPVPLTPANPGLPEVDFRLLGSADLIQVQGARQATFPEGQRWHSMLALKKPTIYRDLNLNIYI